MGMRQDKAGSYRSQFTAQWAMLFFVLVASFGLVAYDQYVEHDSTTLREQTRLLAQARVVDQNLAKQLEGTDKVLISLRDELALRHEGNRFPAADNSRLAALELAIPGVRTLLALDATGIVRLSNRPELVGINLSRREYFQAPREFPDSGRLFVSRPFQTILGVWGINLTRVVIGRKGEFAGVVTATLDAQYFNTLLSSVSYAPDLRAVLVHGDGDIFLMVPEARPVQGKNIAQPDSFFQRHMLSGRQENVYSGQTFATGERRMVALRTIEPGGVPLDKPLVAMVTRDLDAVHDGWLRHVAGIAIPFALTLLLTGSALAIFQRRQRLHLKRLERADAELRAREERFRTLFENSADAILLHPLTGPNGSVGRFVEANAVAVARYGYSRDELLTMTPIDLDEVRTYPSPADLDAFQAHAREAGHLLFERTHVTKDGRRIPVEVSAHVFEMHDETLMLSIVRDITERREREEALKLAGVVLETVDEGVVVTDAQSRIVSVNPGFTEITGYPQEEVLGRTPKLLSAGTNSADFYRNMWETLRNTGSWKGEVLNRKKSGEFYVEWLSIKQLCDERGAVSHYVGVFSDISERKASEERMHHLAHSDALTGLANRMLLTDRIHQALSKARRDRKRAAVLFFDLDRFKPVNDQFGHDVGDLLLQQVAQRVLACVRESDTVARLGGDEFVVLLTEIEEEANALAVGRKIIAALQRPFDPLGHLVTIGASIGVAVFPEHGGDETALLKNADIAMYKAKACGRNTVMPFTNDTAHELA